MICLEDIMPYEVYNKTKISTIVDTPILCEPVVPSITRLKFLLL